REVLRVQVVLEVEDPREARAVPQRIGPRAVGVLPLDEIADALVHRAPLGAPGGEERQERPGRLARQGLAAAGQVSVVVGAQGLAPAAVVVLPLLEPADRPLDVVLRAVLADRAQSAKHGPGAVDVVDAPAPVPGPR